MARIHRLPEVLVNQIAAGEAVERPASVVKELVENALDAGARSIDVVVEQGGRRRVRVEDDGCGMEPEDARLALERHATSKIAVISDLAAIRTLGFRGEALPAIASVAQLTLTTAAAAGGGIRIDVEGGEERREQPAARPPGTSVEVRNLFFNTPARAKFLRSVPTELSRIVEVVQAAALANPPVRFRLEHDGREILLASKAAGLRDRLRAVFGADLEEGMVAVEGGREPLSVSGFVSRPAQARAARSLQFLFVNGRPVSDRTLTHAALAACRPHFPRDRFAAYALFLELPPAEVDVNVHPSKREVRFRTPGAVHALLQAAIEAALAADRPIVTLAAPGALPRLSVSEAVEAFLQRPAPPAPVRSPAAAEAVPLPAAGGERRVVGQIGATFILVEEPDGLLIADQHAAHERVLYDRFRAGRRSGSVPVQALLFPLTVELRPAAAARLERLLGSLADLGFAVEPFGGEAFRVREVPAIVAQADLARLLRDLADQLEEGGPTAASDLEHGIAALAACHGAVRAGMRLDPARCRQVVDDLLDGGHALTCPHGRPAVVRYPLRDLERAFRRP